ncbi:MAG: sigma factor [Candidatus Heimdallarchaeaceae archaeon]
MEQRNGIQIEDHISLIQKHAQVALSKIKKPSCYDLEDLYQEGFRVFMVSKKHYRNDGPASFKTYLISCLRNHFCYLVKKSYRSINHLNGFENGFLEVLCIENNVVEELLTTLSHHNFNSVEYRYIMFLLNTPERVQKEFRNNIGKQRQVIRRELGLSSYKENALRRSIKDRLEKCYA